MTPPNLLHSHILSTVTDAELSLVKQIVLELFIGNPDKYKSSKPIGILLGGQPASGKSGLIKHIRQGDLNRRFVVINGDEFRSYHPRSRQIAEHCGQDAPTYTQPLSNALVEYLKAECLRLKLNFIIEGTMRSYSVIEQTANEAKKAGFRCEAHVLAVSREDSLLGIFQRFEEDIKRTGVGRFSAIDIHDEAYREIPINLGKADQANLVDRIVIYSRQPDGQLTIEIDKMANAGPKVDFSAEFSRLRLPLYDSVFYREQWLALNQLAQKRLGTDAVYLEQIQEFIDSFGPN